MLTYYIESNTWELGHSKQIGTLKVNLILKNQAGRSVVVAVSPSSFRSSDRIVFCY